MVLGFHELVDVLELILANPDILANPCATGKDGGPLYSTTLTVLTKGMAFGTLEEYREALKKLIVALSLEGHVDLAEKINRLMFESVTASGVEQLSELAVLLREVRAVVSHSLRNSIGPLESFAKNHRRVIGY